MKHLVSGFIGVPTGHWNAWTNSSEFIIIPFTLQNPRILSRGKHSIFGIANLIRQIV